MKHLHITMKMADLIHLNHHLLKVIDRFGIQLGFGDQTLEQVCRKHAIEPGLFIEIVKSFMDEDYIPGDSIKHYPLQMVVDYLHRTHLFYMEVKIPGIERLIDELAEKAEGYKDHILLLKNFFNQYKQELEAHIRREEEEVYPYILELEKAGMSQLVPDALSRQMKLYPISKYANEHDDLEEKLFDLKNIIIKYLPPPFDGQLCHRILQELFGLEQDLNDHASLEDKTLVPRVMEMEKALANNQ